MGRLWEQVHNDAKWDLTRDLAEQVAEARADATGAAESVALSASAAASSADDAAAIASQARQDVGALASSAGISRVAAESARGRAEAAAATAVAISAENLDLTGNLALAAIARSAGISDQIAQTVPSMFWAKGAPTLSTINVTAEPDGEGKKDDDDD